jgi:DNA-binding winged helix-turn-helix (wHTH) protein/uncharacterized protein YjbI with pentapeptide repeats
MGTQQGHLFQFGPFILDLNNRELSKEGKPVHLETLAFEVLRVLVEKHGKLVSMDELSECWPRDKGSEGDVFHQIMRIRKALEDTSKDHRYIKNKPKRGYRFVADVVVLEPAKDESMEQAQLQKFVETLHGEYVAIGYRESIEDSKESTEEKSQALFDPKTIFVPLECVPVTGPACDALEWIEEGIEKGAGQLLRANYGMGKSFLTIKLMLRLMERYKEAPGQNRMPLHYPLKKHLSNIDRPEGILKNLHDECLKHQFPITDYDEFKRRMKAGEFVVILDGFDEIPYLLNFSMIKPVEWPMKILACLDLRHFGDCPWLVTSRPGAFARVFAEPEAKQQLMENYRVADLLAWQEDRQWRNYVHACHDLADSEIFKPDLKVDPPHSTSKTIRDEFIAFVSKHPNLKILTNTPLFARMLVVIWREISEDLDEIGLYRKYSDRVLKSRDVANLPPSSEIEMRRQCVESLALYLFISNKLSCTEADLTDVASLDNRVSGKVAIRNFVELLKTYSLLKYDSADRELEFSHESFKEYFLACALLRQTQEAGGWEKLEILQERRIPANTLAFLGRLLAKPENAGLRTELAQLLGPNKVEKTLFDFRFNLIGIALATRLPLAGAWLSEMMVTEFNFVGCDLHQAQMDGVIATDVNFSWADLSDAGLKNAKLRRSILTGTNLRWANLTGANLTNIHLHKPILADDLPKLFGAILDGIVAGQKDLAYLQDALEQDELRMARESGGTESPRSE